MARPKFSLAMLLQHNVMTHIKSVNLLLHFTFCIGTRLWTKTEGSWFDFRQEKDIHPFSKESREALAPTQSYIQWMQGKITGDMRPGREGNH